ncbi:MAG: phosphatidylinositol kinase [Burkholderia sp.]|nr:phosphatidylinositol kinase [Burkholderia sp.]
MAQERTLAVFAHLDDAFVPAGLLKLTEEGSNVLASEFAYGLKYLERANAMEIDPVSLSLEDKPGIRGKKMFPPERLSFFGGIRDAAPDAWGRRVIEAKLKAPANSLPESTYLLEAGSNRIGALDVRMSVKSPLHAGENPISELSYLLEAAERIEAGMPVPARLEAIFNGGSALGGARPKATVRDNDGLLWLSKFSSHGEVLNVPEIEAATLFLAKQCGLSVPEAKVIHVNDRAVMLIRRFDRYWAPAGTMLPPEASLIDTKSGKGLIEKRLPFVSGLTMLRCDETDARTMSYADLAQAIQKYCHPAVIRDNNRELFARMVYNIFVTNDDDHLRNHGFLWDPRIKGWRLSPLYDVMPRPSVASERFLFLGVGQQGRLATLDNAMSSRVRFSISAKEATAIIAATWEKVREWRVYFEEFGASTEAIEQADSAFRHIDELASAELRAKIP